MGNKFALSFSSSSDVATRLCVIVVLKASVALLAAGLLVSAADAVAAPQGSRRIGDENIARQGSFYCGRLDNKWLPGQSLGDGRFLSYAAERQSLAAKLARPKSGSQNQLRQRISVLNSLIARGTTACNSLRDGAGRHALRFAVRGKVGLALRGAGASGTAATAGSRSNLLAVSSGGQLTSAVASGEAPIQRFLVAPNNKLYVVFSVPTNLGDTTQPGDCILAEVDTSTGIPTCVDSSLTGINWPYDESSFHNPPIQFDSTGAIYYSGWSSGGASAVLRRHLNDSTVSLMNDNVYINDFLVRPDGTVLLTGTTRSSNAMWVRRISPGGSLKNLLTSWTAWYMTPLPNGKVAIGSIDNRAWGTFTYNPEIDAVDPSRYIGSATMLGYLGEPAPEHDTDPLCQGQNASTTFCGTSGAVIKSAHTTLNGEVYAVTGFGAEGVLARYYGDIALPVTSFKSIAVSQGILNHLVLSGLNSARQNITTLFDTEDGSEVELIGVDQEIEVYHLNFVAAENKIMFDGLRFADNTYVLGEIDLATMTVISSPTGTGKLVDFQTF